MAEVEKPITPVFLLPLGTELYPPALHQTLATTPRIHSIIPTALVVISVKVLAAEILMFIQEPMTIEVTKATSRISYLAQLADHLSPAKTTEHGIQEVHSRASAGILLLKAIST
ncbi:uncharacterized protein LOC142795545 [Rhipicephalus microplus]|uniref:uncharacterized protein LOC142795545 n=1 Tax=Rhipicephalus microplus TaxID=6941 RepID=UPI003F6AE0B4